MDTTDAKLVLIDGELQIKDAHQSLNIFGNWVKITNYTSIANTVVSKIELLTDKPSGLNIYETNCFNIDFDNDEGGPARRAGRIGKWINPNEPSEYYYGLIAIGTADISDIGSGGMKKTWWIWGMDEMGEEHIYLYHNPYFPTVIQVFSLAGTETAVRKIRFDDGVTPTNFMVN